MPATSGFGDGEAVSQNASPPATVPTATARYPSDGLHASGSSAPSIGGRPGRRVVSMPHHLLSQGVAGLKVDSPQPIRSWPYWFQIGFLAFVKEV
jgi:hypothetical protein